ncbi:flagellar protein FlgN [Bacillus salitolerans]|uniref:Flagellar protein FlgN n=1 Tax=Bacillus salitolerans TaxID=1437434 RepID=A0ABW4LNW8_9BACI
MDAENLMNTLTKLLRLHQSLLQVSEKKSEIVKQNDIDALSLIMKDENKHVLAINQLEEERKLLVAKVMSGHPFDQESPTLSDCIKIVNEEQGEKLAELQQELLEVLGRLQEVNKLNQQLVHQSLQFVNLNIDMLRPQQVEYNYGNQKSTTTPKSQTYFDSKA